MIDPLEALVIIAAGMAAGTINTIVGSGSLIAFPTLLLLGYPPLVANVSNTVGLAPGTSAGRSATGASCRANGRGPGRWPSPRVWAGSRGPRSCSFCRRAHSPGSCPC